MTVHLSDHRLPYGINGRQMQENLSELHRLRGRQDNNFLPFSAYAHRAVSDGHRVKPAASRHGTRHRSSRCRTNQALTVPISTMMPGPMVEETVMRFR